MIRSSRAQMIAVLAVGGLLGYVASSSRLDVFRIAKAEPVQRAAERTGDFTGHSSTQMAFTIQKAAPKPGASSKTAEHSCCSAGSARSQLVAVNNVNAKLDSLQAEGKKPNILFIMGDDVGWFNIGAYHQGIMSGKTPNLDKLAREGMRFTDYYAEASCTAGRANFITGEIPLRTGLTTVGPGGRRCRHARPGLHDRHCAQGAGLCHGPIRQEPPGRPEQVPADAARLRRILRLSVPPRRHVGSVLVLVPLRPGFLRDTYGPRNLVHCWATDTDDDDRMPRWGKIGKQKIVDEGPLRPFKNMDGRQHWQAGPPGSKYDMETFDEVLVENTNRFMDKAKKDGKPFFIWHNTTRMHVFTFLSQKYQETMNYQDELRPGRSRHDADGRFHRRHHETPGRHRRGGQHPCRLQHRQRGRGIHLAGRRHDAVQSHQGHGHGRRLPRAVHRPLAGQDQAGHGRKRPLLRSGLVPHHASPLPAIPNITDELLKGVKLGDRTYKNHLDGYNQLDLLLGKGPSKREELFYFGGPHLGAVRIGDFKYQFYQQPQGWPGPKVTTDMPTIVNIRQDPFERTPSIGSRA